MSETPFPTTYNFCGKELTKENYCLMLEKKKKEYFLAGGKTKKIEKVYDVSGINSINPEEEDQLEQLNHFVKQMDFVSFSSF